MTENSLAAVGLLLAFLVVMAVIGALFTSFNQFDYGCREAGGVPVSYYDDNSDFIQDCKKL